MRRALLVLFTAATGCVSAAPLRFELGTAARMGPPAPDDDKWPAVVLVDERLIRHRVYSAPETYYEHHRAVRIMRDDGLGWAALKIRVGPGEELVALAAQTILPTGEVVPLDPANVVWGSDLETCGDAGRSYGHASFALPRAVPGAVVEYHYAIRRLGWAWAYEHTLLEGVPVRRASFELDSYEGFEIQSLARGFEAYSGCPPAEASRTRTCWAASNVMPPAREPLAGSPERAAPRVAFAVARVGTIHHQGVPVRFDEAVYSDWVEVAKPNWAAAAAAAAHPPPALVEPRPTEKGRAGVVELWRRVSSRIADRAGYCEYEEGRRMHQIVESGYGTPTERALLMVSVLLAWGYEAGVALFPDEDHDDPVLKSPTEVQRLVVWVRPDSDSSEMMLDPRCMGCAAGELSPDLRGRAGFLIEPPPRAELARMHGGVGGVQVSTRGVSTTDRVEPLQVETELALEDRGLVARHGRLQARGSAAAELRYQFAENPLPPAELEEQLRKQYLDGVEDGRITIGGLDQPDSPVELTYEGVLFARGGYIRSGAWTLIPLRALFGAGWIDALERERRSPLTFGEQPSWVHVVKLAVPAGMSVHSLPRSGSVELPAGNYRLDVTQAGGAVTISETLDIKRRHHDASSYPALYTFIEAVRSLRTKPLILHAR